eukprot:PhM_4_TR5216/c0_g1_i1/m.103703
MGACGGLREVADLVRRHRFRLEEIRHREVDVGVEVVDVGTELGLHDFEQLQSAESGDEGRRRHHGGDDVATDALYVHGIRLGDIVARGADVCRCRDEVDVAVLGIVLLECKGVHHKGHVGLRFEGVEEALRLGRPLLFTLFVCIVGSAWLLGLDFFLRGGDDNIRLGHKRRHCHGLANGSHVRHAHRKGDTIKLCSEPRCTANEGDVLLVSVAERNQVRALPGSGPKRFIRCSVDFVRRVGEQELLDCIYKCVFKEPTRPLDTLLGGRRAFRNVGTVCRTHNGVHRRRLQTRHPTLGIGKERVDFSRGVGEHACKHILCIMDAMLHCRRVEMHRARRCPAGVLVVVAAIVVLCETRHNHLHVCLGAQCACLHQGLAELHTLGIDIDTRWDVVEGVDDDTLLRPKAFVECVFCVLCNLFGKHTKLGTAVHRTGTVGSRFGFVLTNVLVSKKKLP